MFFRADSISPEQFKCLQELPNLKDLRVQVLYVKDEAIVSTLCNILPRMENFTVMQGSFEVDISCFPKLEKMIKMSFFRCKFYNLAYFETLMSKLVPQCFKRLKIVDTSVTKGISSFYKFF